MNHVLSAPLDYDQVSLHSLGSGLPPSIKLVECNQGNIEFNILYKHQGHVLTRSADKTSQLGSNLISIQLSNYLAPISIAKPAKFYIKLRFNDIHRFIYGIRRADPKYTTFYGTLVK